jgi:peroxiredoxin
VLTLLGLSLIANVVLGLALLRLAGRPWPSPAMRSERASVPAVGDQLPSLEARGKDTHREVLTFEPRGRPTLLYVFAPTCRWCARNLDNAKVVFAAAANTYRIVALSLAPEAGTAASDFPANVQILVEPSPAAYEPYHLGSTPATLVISPEGRVLQAWVGAYTGDIGKEVESHFGVALPGLARDAGN